MPVIKKNGIVTPVTQGKIQIQSKATEVYYKILSITPITFFP